LSLTLFERVPLNQLLNRTVQNESTPNSDNQLNLFI
jgi:hypothetical protein